MFASGLPAGARNSIADVPGVTVGHATLVHGDIRTGVTAIRPHRGNVFLDKPVAAAEVLNGFGASVGLMFLNELGVLETPILLTNTFGVGTCETALIRRTIRDVPGVGRTTSTVHPVVCECNDGWLNDIQALAVTEADALAALDATAKDFARGAVGAGTGMSSFGLKGGIGTASRQVKLGGDVFHLGALVLANFGRAGDLVLPDGRRIDPRATPVPEAGSIIIILATDAPMDHRQLGRVARRAGVGLARCGSAWGNGSGDLAIAFTTANRIPHAPKDKILPMQVIAEDQIDGFFHATADTVQHAVIDALISAEPMTGRDGHHRQALREFL